MRSLDFIFLDNFEKRRYRGEKEENDNIKLRLKRDYDRNGKINFLRRSLITKFWINETLI